MTANAGMIAAGTFGGIWFVMAAGKLVNPFNVEALLVEDWSTHVLGWLFFRNESLNVPYGRIYGLLYPLGTTIGYTDSIPWAAFFFRLFSWALPKNFQFIGLFMMSCYVFNAACGAWVVRAVSPRQIDQALGGVFFVLLPALLLRLGHPSLCAQGILLVPLGLAIRMAADPRQAKRMALVALGLCTLAAGFHPYLAVMVLTVAAAVPVKLWLIDKKLPLLWALGVLVAMPLAMLAVFAFFGYFLGGVERSGLGFGGFSADLGTFVNPLAYSRWFHAKPQGGLQYEGFAYLGVGVMLLIALTLLSLLVRARSAWRLPWRRLLFFVPGVLLTAAFSFATPWSLFGQPVYDFASFYAQVPPNLLGPFRSSGRFIWPLMYALVTFGVVGVVRLWRHLPWAPPAVLAIALALQLGDITNAPVADHFKPSALMKLTNPAWANVDGKYEHLDIVPAEIWSICGGRAGYRHPVVIGLAYHAYLHHLTYNSGYVARASVDQAATCQREEQKVMAGELDPKTVYVVWPDIAQSMMQHGAVCGPLDGLIICVRPAGGDDAFASALKASQPH